MVKVTLHALEQFLFRKGEVKRGEKPTNRQLKGAEKQVLDMIEKAWLETFDKDPGLIRRFIDNKFCDAEYFRLGRWRFVVCDCDTIVTVEENRFENTKRLKRRKGGHKSKRQRAREKNY